MIFFCLTYFVIIQFFCLYFRLFRALLRFVFVFLHRHEQQNRAIFILIRLEMKITEGRGGAVGWWR